MSNKKFSVAVLMLMIAGLAFAGFVFIPKGSDSNMIKVEGHMLKTTDLFSNKAVNVDVKSFLLDRDLVTVADFESFVSATGYITEAEKFGDAGVFVNQGWEMVVGANFRYPFGKNKEGAKPDHPVTQVSWNDAQAYAAWKGKRLPTQWEWEVAARNGDNMDQSYSWGSDLVVNGQFKANTWQGSFPFHNTVDDGYQFTSPVGAFGANKLGFTDMGGNVWQWCADDTMPDDNESEVDASPRKVMRGGSFLCDPLVCEGYRVNGRSSSTPDSSLGHIGFRCAKDVN